MNKDYTIPEIWQLIGMKRQAITWKDNNREVLFSLKADYKHAYGKRSKQKIKIKKEITF